MQHRTVTSHPIPITTGTIFKPVAALTPDELRHTASLFRCLAFRLELGPPSVDLVPEGLVLEGTLLFWTKFQSKGRVHWWGCKPPFSRFKVANPHLGTRLSHFCPDAGGVILAALFEGLVFPLLHTFQ